MAVEGNFQEAIADFVTDLTTADQVTISQAVFQDTFGVSDITASHRVLTGVRDGSLVPIVLSNDYFGMMGGQDEKSCNLNQCDISLDYSVHKWTLGEYACRAAICLRNVEEDFLVFWQDYRQMLEDPTIDGNSAEGYLAFLMDRVAETVKGTSWRVSYLGDKGSANTLVNKNDGFLTQLVAGNGVKMNFLAAGAIPTGKEIYESMRAAYETAAESDEPWTDEDDIAWRMPLRVAKRLVAMLNTAADLSQYNCDCIDPMAITNARVFSVDNLKIFGIPVKAYGEIDRSYKWVPEFDSQYWVALVRDSNWLLGINSTDKMEQFRIFYDQKDLKVYIDMMVRIGAGVPLDEYILIGQDVEDEEGGDPDPGDGDGGEPGDGGGN